MEGAKIYTLTGLTQEQVVETLTAELPGDAYKPVPYSPGLTDISPAYCWEALTKVFGLCGTGWWITPTDLEVRSEEKTSKAGRTRTVYIATMRAEFQYRFLCPWGKDAEEYQGGDLFVKVSEPLWTVGHSENENEGYAIRGSLTNALGSAARFLLWQLRVYKNLHETPKKKLPPIVAASDAREIEITFGKHYDKETRTGKTMGEVYDADRGYLAWLRDKFDPKGDDRKIRIQQAAIFLLDTDSPKQEALDEAATFSLGVNDGPAATDAQKSRIHDLVVQVVGCNDERDHVDQSLHKRNHPPVEGLTEKYAFDLIAALTNALATKQK